MHFLCCCKTCAQLPEGEDLRNVSTAEMSEHILYSFKLNSDFESSISLGCDSFIWEALMYRDQVASARFVINCLKTMLRIIHEAKPKNYEFELLLRAQTEGSRLPVGVIYRGVIIACKQEASIQVQFPKCKSLFKWMVAGFEERIENIQNGVKTKQLLPKLPEKTADEFASLLSNLKIESHETFELAIGKPRQSTVFKDTAVET